MTKYRPICRAEVIYKSGVPDKKFQASIGTARSPVNHEVRHCQPGLRAKINRFERLVVPVLYVIAACQNLRVIRRDQEDIVVIACREERVIPLKNNVEHRACRDSDTETKITAAKVVYVIQGEPAYGLCTKAAEGIRIMFLPGVTARRDEEHARGDCRLRGLGYHVVFKIGLVRETNVIHNHLCTRIAERVDRADERCCCTARRKSQRRAWRDVMHNLQHGRTFIA